MTRVLTLLSLATFMGLASSAGAQDAPRTIFGVDVSGSSTFLVDQPSADAAAAFVDNYVAALAPPHALTMISIGDAGLGSRVIDIRATVTRNRASNAKTLSAQFSGYFRSLPGLVARGRIAAQGSTSLISFFQSVEPVCAAGNATLVVFSDGLEWSARVDGKALATGKKGLPKPDRAFLKGCAVTLLGVGQLKAGLNGDGLSERLVPQWRAYLVAAGGAPVSVVGSGFSF